MQSAQALLDGLIDYAGLFPPASLDMKSAVQSYAEYNGSDDRALLGRFILPAGRLDEFERAAGEFIGEKPESTWRLSVIAGANLAETRRRAVAFNLRRAGAALRPRMLCDAIEFPVASIHEAAHAMEMFPESFDLFFEIPIDADPSGQIAQLKGSRGFAKMRTGGVVESAIPSATNVLRFIRACIANGVPFKATAGLHHAVRGSYRLTYEADSATGTMFGFLNIFMAAALAAEGADDDVLLEILNETDRAAFRFDDNGARWRDHRVPAESLDRLRRRSALSFGSCSFVEPVSELKAMNLI